MTKRWSSTKSNLIRTKRQASKGERAKGKHELIRVSGPQFASIPKPQLRRPDEGL